ncbi:nuclear factor erythroid 2-related factor 1 isoform X3 [Heterocephalus glaber]|uniref:Endoplasmic reticulum membrane sensor NFE2L1 n=1 Tax=Heterocephalus glaber TaxID=10181 RepID=A0AAX6PVK2_HETGA|nr:nuclear factor erythroid 2-related factor 1 isoform X3 [Heterocephalus glaber]
MLSLKKYLTEGLLQFTILLSLIGVRVDVDTYLTSQLPPLREIILGPSSAYTQTQFHNLRNTLDGYGIHPKSIDLDNYFTARRLLSQVRALDRFQVPTTEVNAWLVHRDPEGSVSGSQPSSGLALESSSGLQDVTGPDNGVRESEPEQGLSEDLEDLGAVAPPVSGDLTKEDIDLIDILWRQDIDLGAGREVFDYSHRQKEQDVDKESRDGRGEQEDTWAGEGSDALARDLLVDGETGECFPAQAMEVNTSGGETLYSGPPGDALSTSYSLAPSTAINQNVSLHQASLGSCSQDFSLFSPEVESLPPAASSPVLLPLVPSNSTSLNATFSPGGLAGLFFPPQLNGTANDTAGPELPDPLGGLLDEAMLDEISLMDLAIEEGFNPAQASRLEEEFDSDSGLSLDSSHSPSSLSGSEGSSSSASSASSASSSASSASSSTSSSFSEEGAVGYSSDSETLDLEEAEGAVGYQPEYSKFCRMSYQDPSQLSCLPYLEHVGHNHTYNLAPSALDAADLPPAGGLKRGGKEKQADFLEKQMSRDEHRARAMKIPFTNDKIINLPVEEFNELLSKYQLSEAQLGLIRDIRRRGKNKMAAQNCRRRKLDTILNLERAVEDLRRDKARLLREKADSLRSLRQMKQKVQSLYQEVFGRLRDENGRPYSPSQYALQYAGDGSVLLIPRAMAEQQAHARRQERKPKERRK